ncbi:hypothetical protein [Leptolyngbya sp. FACHB-261]|uniref:hypothetical protein n=1 Tax=Leptolyngbya sp. FACHB-261 TaxID=2692806 RepID=UPI001684F644|nr:hypothetical protein [Leptolyngbya sp. FACHB-261]MBD2104632.1 hypothetical protein [Leptolyngbya sp. FACHB-261]
MLVFLMNEQLVPSHQVCQTCLLANVNGSPRWQGGTLRCGRALPKLVASQPDLYQCPMGFQLTNVDCLED